jgi:hypothetical protein
LNGDLAKGDILSGWAQSVMLPVPALSVRSCAPAVVPSIVLFSLMSPAPGPVASVTDPVSVVTPVSVISSSVVCMSPAVEIAAAEMLTVPSD